MKKIRPLILFLFLVHLYNVHKHKLNKKSCFFPNNIFFDKLSAFYNN